MSKLTKTYIFDEISKRYFLKIHRSAGFMEPHTKYKLIDKNLIPRGASVLSVKIKYGYESNDLEVLENQFESLRIDPVGVNSDIDGG